MSDPNLTTMREADGFRDRMAEFWRDAHRTLNKASERGEGPFILTPDGKAFMAERDTKESNVDAE